MNKRIISITITILMCLSVFSLSVAAAPSITCSYADGVVEYTGSGFAASTNYNIRVVDTTVGELISMKGITSDTNGIITATDTVGMLTKTSYTIYVNNLDGTLAAQTELAVSAIDAQTPNITTQPSNITVNVNDTATLSVTASVTDGGTLTYQWYSNTSNSTTGGTPVGTGASYSASTTTAGTYYYYVVVTNTNGSASGTKTATAISNVATVTVTTYFGGGSGGGGGGSSSITVTYVKDSDIVIKDGQVEVNIESGSTLLSKAQMDDLIEKNKTMPIVIKGNGYTITFAEGTMESVSGKSSFDFGVTFNTGGNLTSIRSLSLGRFAFMVHFNYSGILPAEAEITINIGAQFAGRNVEYYYYNETTKKLELIQKVTVDEKGNVTVTQTHCSDFVFLTQPEEAVPVEVTPEPPTPTAVFSDIANHWAKADIEFVTEMGLFSGTGNGMFSPDATMTRGMAVTVICKYSNADISGFTSSRFSDVAADAWYAPYVEWAAEKGIVQGVGDDKFAPEQPVTREQMAVILMNFANKTGIQFAEGDGNDSPFVDDDKISSWARDAVTEIKMLGAISGRPDGSFDPTGTATRAEVASILKRFILKIV